MLALDEQVAGWYEAERLVAEFAVARVWVERCVGLHGRRPEVVRVLEGCEVALVLEGCDVAPVLEEQLEGLLEVRFEMVQDVVELVVVEVLRFLVAHSKRVCCKAERQHTESGIVQKSHTHDSNSSSTKILCLA